LETGVERLRVEQREHPSQGVVGRKAMRQRQQMAKPLLLAAAQALDVLPAIHADEHRRAGQHDHIA